MFTEEEFEDFILSARYGEDEDVQEYLSRGMDPKTVTDDQGNTALHMAAANGHENIAKILINAGAQNIPNKNGNTPLHWAVQNSHKNIVVLIIQSIKEVNVLKQNEFGKDIISEAIRNKDTEIRDILVSTVDMTHINQTLGTKDDDNQDVQIAPEDVLPPGEEPSEDPQ